MEGEAGAADGIGEIPDAAEAAEGAEERSSQEEGKEVKLEWENGGNDEISEEAGGGRARLSGSRQESGQDLMTLSFLQSYLSPFRVGPG